MKKVYMLEVWDGYDCSTERTAYSSLARAKAALRRELVAMWEKGDVRCDLWDANIVELTLNPS